MTPYASATSGLPANQEMIDGYVDGLDLSSPEPSANRSRSYRHGFENGRSDRNHQFIEHADIRRDKADAAMAADAMDAGYGEKP